MGWATEFQFPAKLMKIFSLRHRVQTGCGTHPISYPMGSGGALTPWAKWPGREADLSPHSSVELKYPWSYFSALQYFFMAWCLIKRWILFHGVVVG